MSHLSVTMELAPYDVFVSDYDYGLLYKSDYQMRLDQMSTYYYQYALFVRLPSLLIYS